MIETTTNTELVTLTPELKDVINDLQSRQKMTQRGIIDLFILFEKGILLSQLNESLNVFVSNGRMTGRARIEIINHINS